MGFVLLCEEELLKELTLLALDFLLCWPKPLNTMLDEIHRTYSMFMQHLMS